METVTYHILENNPDDRGSKFFIPAEVVTFAQPITEMHLVTILPDEIRGNHYHFARREMIILQHEDQWQLAWQPETADDIQTKNFFGNGTVAIRIEPRTTHAIKNTGQQPLTLFCFSNHRGAADDPDTTRKVII